ncbi:MAG: ribonuclease R [Sedimentisphaerales bacterium]|nr:ribonuclease R [Sedimentisphaerales bacterium]
MAQVYKDRIIKLLKRNDYEPLRLAHLAKALGVSSENYEQFKEDFDQLRQSGHVIIGAKNMISLPSLAGQIVGTFRANPKGFGFVSPQQANTHGDLFIPPNATAEAMTGDIVIAKVKKQGKRDGQMQYAGEIIEIIERAQNKFVGILLRHPEGWIVQPDGSGFFDPISVDDITAKGAEEKDKVIVEILSYPTEKYLARGVIIEVLGKAGRYDTEIKAVIHQFHLPGEFGSECIGQSRQAAAEFNPEKARGREDITDKVIVTIDPPDAKDFDDAISLEKDSDGNWVLGVHIADVSNFVTADSPLDKEAKIRGNSVYLPAKTIPMLPEILSNGICSLQPQQKRYTKSAFITYDNNGDIISRKYANTIICSTQRLTYQQADSILKGHTKDTKPEVTELLKNMETLSRAIEQRRTENGMLHLEMPETELIMDKSGQVVDAAPADTSYPHTMIEMFMVEANDAVASLLDRQNIPLMRRIHPEPDILSTKNLIRLIKAFGYTLPRNPDRKVIQNLLDSVKGKDISLAVNIAVLRSFEKAQYAPDNIGHYALASRHYCHFTSPIRRYADLLVHRVLDLYLHNRINDARHNSASQNLAEIGKHITFTEQQAESAENELKTVLILQMLSKKIGETINGVVTGLTNFGIFVQCKKFGIEGLIRMADLGPDSWKYNDKSQSIVGQHSGICIRMGQSLQACITSVNLPARQLNLIPLEPLVKEKSLKKTKKEKRKFPHKQKHSKKQKRRK